LGSGPAEVQFSGSGGFGGGAYPTVNLGGVSAPILWDNNPYLPNDCELTLENLGSSGPMVFQNPLVLGAGKRSIATFFGSGDTHARLSGKLSGIGGLKKNGGLVLELTAENNYSGETEVIAGILRLCNSQALPGGIGRDGGISNLNFSDISGYYGSAVTIDGISYHYSSGSICAVELAAGDFTRELGTGPSQVQFTGSGGFSAYGSNRIVNLGGASALVTWGMNSFVPASRSLCLSSDFSNATIDFQNPIDLGSSTRSIMVGNGSAFIDAILSGCLTGTGKLEKSGLGTLQLIAINTSSINLVVKGGTLLADGSLTASSSISVDYGGTVGGIGLAGSVYVNSGGHVAPGDGIGVLTLASSMVLLNGAKLDIDLATTNSSDRIDMTSSTLFINNQKFSDFTFNTLTGFGQGIYVLIDAGEIQGTLNSSCTGMIAGLPATLSVSGNDLVLTVVPEPSTFMMLAIGAIGLLAFARRRKR
jgi:hypothetical protein